MTVRKSVAFLTALAALVAAAPTHAGFGPESAVAGDARPAANFLFGTLSPDEALSLALPSGRRLGVPGPLWGGSPMLRGVSGPQLSVVLGTIEHPCASGTCAEGRSASDLGLGGSEPARSAALERLLPGSAAWDGNLAKGYVFLGVEAVALFSYLRARGADGDAAAADGGLADGRSDAVGLASAAGALVEPLSGEGMLDAPSLALAPRARATMSWRGAASEAAKLDATAVGQSAAAGPRVGLATTVADRVAGLVDAFRGLRLNSFEIADNTRLRIHAKTGHHGHCFVVLTRKF
jgi:hypothetical protein